MKYRILHIILLFFCYTLTLSAQELSVKSFRLLENDLTANTYATMVKDRNGEVAALIKVVTTEQGFLFDGGMTGIVLIKQGTGEVWVYVPHGIKRINIQHQQFGVLRDYYFPIPIEKARTYELVLTTPKVETEVEENLNNVRANFFILRTNQPKASIRVDGYPYQCSNDGSITGMLPYGEHRYQVRHPSYETAEGSFIIDSEPVDFQIPLTKRNISRWYVQGCMGGQYTRGRLSFTYNNELNFKYTKLYSYNAQLGIGYNFNTSWGARLVINGGKSKYNYSSDYEWNWNYISPVVDLTTNLSNMIFGYNPERKVDFGAFVGIGTNIGFYNKELQELLENDNINVNLPWKGPKAFFIGCIGTSIDYHISNNWTATFEVQINSIDYSYYNSEVQGANKRYFNALIGLKYTFD